jgi:hypothetical protein
MSRILVAGLDGSLRAFGVATAWLDLNTLDIEIKALELVETELSKDKKVRSSSDYMARAMVLKTKVHAAIAGCITAFYEVPSGGQDYRSVMGFGIVIGTYAGLPIPGAEVSPGEAKMAAIGTRTGGKEDMRAWAAEAYPDAPWLRYERNGKGYLKGELTGKNEHLADAVAIIKAGIKTPSFQQTIAILRQNTHLLQAA